MDVLGRSTPVFRDDVISSYPSHQVGEEGGTEGGTDRCLDGRSDREVWKGGGDGGNVSVGGGRGRGGRGREGEGRLEVGGIM